MYFFVRTQDPRPTFQLDMTTEERAIMIKHVAYWSEKAVLAKRTGRSLIRNVEPKRVRCCTASQRQQRRMT